MYRQIIIPDKNIYPLHLPDEFIGRQVEVIAFTVNEESSSAQSQSKAKRIEELTKKLENYRVDMNNFKFDRNKANDYD